MNVKTWLMWTVGIGILGVLFYSIGLSEITNVLKQSSGWVIVLIIGVYVINVVLASYNLKIMVSPYRKIGWKNACEYYTATWIVSLFVPSKLGELSLIFFLKTLGVNLNQRTAIVTLDRGISFLIVVACAIAGAVFMNLEKYILPIVMVIAICGGGMLLISWKPFRKMVMHITKKIVPADIEEIYATAIFFIKQRPYLLLMNMLVTILIFLISFIALKLQYIDLGIHVPLAAIAMMSSIVRIVSLIPVTLSGLGIREISAVYLFSLIGVPAEATFAVYLVRLIVSYGLAVLWTVGKHKSLFRIILRKSQQEIT